MLQDSTVIIKYDIYKLVTCKKWYLGDICQKMTTEVQKCNVNSW